MKKKSKTGRCYGGSSGGGKLFIVSAPSGAGKTTLCKKIAKIIPNLKHSVSYTTRLRRRGEINNVHYTFVDKKRFKAMIDRGEFAEWAVVHGNLYGTSLKRLAEAGRSGNDIIVDIDIQGAAQMRHRFKDGVYIFVLPPSLEILRERLRCRMSDSEEEIKKRLRRAKGEIASYKNYDYVIINDRLKKALRELESIIIAERLKVRDA